MLQHAFHLGPLQQLQTWLSFPLPELSSLWHALARSLAISRHGRLMLVVENGIAICQGTHSCSCSSSVIEANLATLPRMPQAFQSSGCSH